MGRKRLPGHIYQSQHATSLRCLQTPVTIWLQLRLVSSPGIIFNYILLAQQYISVIADSKYLITITLDSAYERTVAKLSHIYDDL